MGSTFLTISSAAIVAARSGFGSLIWTSRNDGAHPTGRRRDDPLGILGFPSDRAIRIWSRRLLGRYAVGGAADPRRARMKPAASRSHVASVTPPSRRTFLRTLPFSVSGSSATRST